MKGSNAKYKDSDFALLARLSLSLSSTLTAPTRGIERRPKNHTSRVLRGRKSLYFAFDPFFNPEDLPTAADIQGRVLMDLHLARQRKQTGCKSRFRALLCIDLEQCSHD